MVILCQQMDVEFSSDKLCINESMVIFLCKRFMYIEFW